MIRSVVTSLIEEQPIVFPLLMQHKKHRYIVLMKTSRTCIVLWTEKLALPKSNDQIGDAKTDGFHLRDFEPFGGTIELKNGRENY